MRRMLASLPIALLILTAMILPYSVNADSYLFTGQRISLDSPVHTGPPVISASYAAADTDLPDGLTLTKGVPFISPTEVEQGKIVTIKVKATNDSALDLNYPLVVKVNGNAAGTAQQLSLAPAGSQDVVFTITAQSSGNNDVKVGNLQGFFTVKSSSFFDMFPPYLWGFFGIVLGVIVMLIVLVVTKPSRKGKAGTQPDAGKKPVKGKGKPGKPGAPGTYPFPGQMPGQGMPGMPGMPDGMPMGMQGPGQPGSTYDMPMPGMPPGMQQPGQPPSAMGMQPPFQSQPGMPPQFPQQPGMAPQSPQGMHPPSMQGQQYPPPPHMPQTGQQYPGQQPPQGMPPGMPPQPGRGMPPPISGAPPGQPGMPFGMQPPAAQMPHMMPPPAPGMQQPPHAGGQPPMGPSGPQGMYPPMQPGAQQGMPYQQMGMQQPPYQQMGMPKFSVSNLTITPNNVKVGEPVNVSIIVSNNGAQMGKYSVVLRVGGVVENITDMALTPGASQTASFVVIKDAAGDYYADIDGLGGFFTVIPLAPPSFTVSNFSISPERVRQGQPVIVTASVTNMGEITGSHPLILRVKGIAEAQHDVTLGPNKSQDIEFQIVKDTPGFYPVSMENWTGKFVVEMDWTG
jgi:hypothetical protein